MNLASLSTKKSLLTGLDRGLFLLRISELYAYLRPFLHNRRIKGVQQ